ncbi:major capsid protein [Salinisphaera japonica]|uniref:Elements of external origin n=1 Tax=Salinisphaera japonica YTM-1 TaxID=1209778 RepID=A0A423Q122_9GAMM|nr:major capsid protein [Salinisphaera japonica]ROO31957.1 elements of external origin [Salinisphaera japonica YTM-1]
MPSLDIFRGDAFHMDTLSHTVNQMPRLETKLAAMNLFAQNGIRTTEMWIERQQGDLSLVQTRPRGAPSQQMRGDDRDALKFKVPHASLESTIYPDEVQDVRRFGSDNEMQSVQEVVNARMTKMRRHIDATTEHMRVGALKGQIRDADGSIIHDLHDEFATSPTKASFQFSDPAAKIRQSCLGVSRTIEDELGEEGHSGITAICGPMFFDALIDHPDVREAYARWQDGEALRNDPRAGFQFAGIEFVEYRAKTNGKNYLDPDDCLAFPRGTSLFIERYAPADWIGATNTIGAPVYARMAVDPEFERWAKVHVQSNPLPLAVRPSIVTHIEMA